MSSHIIPYIHNGDTLPPDEATTSKFHAMWNAAASIDDYAQEVNGIDLDVLRRTMIVSHDETTKSGITSLRELGECLVMMGQKLITMSNNKRFLCQMLARGRG